MKKTIKTLIATLFSVASIYSYANPTNYGTSCIPMGEDELNGIMILSYTGQKEVVSQFLNKYCYNSSKIKSNGDKQAYMFAKDIEMLKIFQEKGINILYETSNHNQDILSYYLLSKYTYPALTREEEKEFASKYLKKLGVGTIDASNQQTKFTNEKRREILNYLSDLYKNNPAPRSYQDHYGNTVIHYLVHTAEPEIFKKLVQSHKMNEMLKKNHNGLTPLHLMFTKKEVFDESLEKEKLAQLNQLMEPHFKTTYFNFNMLNLNGLTLADFIELMKDNNPGLYNILSKNYSFKVSQGFQALSEKEKEKLRKEYHDLTRYGTFFVKQP